METENARAPRRPSKSRTGGNVRISARRNSSQPAPRSSHRDGADLVTRIPTARLMAALVSQNMTREGDVTGMIGGARAAARENAASPWLDDFGAAIRNRPDLTLRAVADGPGRARESSTGQPPRTSLRRPGGSPHVSHTAGWQTRMEYPAP